MGGSHPSVFAQVRDDGSFSVRFTVPRQTEPGSYTVAISCGSAPPAEFRVTPPPPVVAPPPPPVVAPPPPPPPPGSTLERIEKVAGGELQSGSILYNPPERMRVGERERIEVRITRALSDGFREGLRGEGERKYSVIPWGGWFRPVGLSPARVEWGGGLFATRRAWLVVWLVVIVCPVGRAFRVCGW